MTITYTSNNTSVATVDGNGLVTFIGSGEVTIEACQSGDDVYYDTCVSRTFTVIDDVTDSDGDGIPDYDDQYPNQTTDQLITIPLVSWGHDFNDSSTTFTATSDSGLPVTLSTDDTSVISIDGFEISFLSGGRATVTASQAGNEVYFPATRTTSFHVVVDPSWIISSESFNILENSNTTISYNASINDGFAEPGSLSYSLAGADKDSFTFNSMDGTINFIDSPDFEAQSSYSVSIVASNSNGQDAKNITINIIDEADVSPVWTTTSDLVDYNENDTIAVPINNSINSGDSEVTYSLLANADSSFFNISKLGSGLAELTFKSPPDYEAKTSYTIAIVASNTSGTSTKNVIIPIIDSNTEIAPTWTNTSQSINISEDTTNALVNYTNDLNEGDSAVSYSLSGADASSFSINSQTGQLSFVSNTYTLPNTVLSFEKTGRSWYGHEFYNDPPEGLWLQFSDPEFITRIGVHLLDPTDTNPYVIQGGLLDQENFRVQGPLEYMWPVYKTPYGLTNWKMVAHVSHTGYIVSSYIDLDETQSRSSSDSSGLTLYTWSTGGTNSSASLPGGKLLRYNIPYVYHVSDNESDGYWSSDPTAGAGDTFFNEALEQGNIESLSGVGKFYINSNFVKTNGSTTVPFYTDMFNGSSHTGTRVDLNVDFEMSPSVTASIWDNGHSDQSERLTLMNTAPASIDFETKNSYSVSIVASNLGGSSSKNLTLNILNVAEIAPSWSAVTETVSINENTTAVPYTATVTDGDATTTYSIDTLSFSLDGVNFTDTTNELATINQDGVISLISPVDYDDNSANKAIKLEVAASNGAGIDYIVIVVNILNVNDEVSNVIVSGNGGTPSGGGSKTEGDTVTLTANPSVGYTFSNWTSSDISIADPTNETISFTMPSSDVSVTANYTINSYTVTVDGDGNQTGSGTYQYYSTVNLVSTSAPEGYTFSNWTSLDVSITNANSPDSALFVMPAKNVTVTANYTINSRSVSIVGNPDAGGSESGSGNHDVFSTVTITATPATGYAFQEWQVLSGDVTLANAYNSTTTFTMPNGNVTITAVYSTLTYNATVNGDGTETGSGVKDYGTTVNITATAPTGYTFSSWTVVTGGVTLADASSSSTNFVMPANNVVVTANYTANSYIVTVYDGTGDGTYDYGTTVDITSDAPPPGYTFSSWTVVTGGVTLADASSSSTNFVMPDNAVEIIAEYILIDYTVTVNGANGFHTATAPGGNFNIGEAVTLTTTPDEGYEFSNWTVDNGGVTLTDANSSSTSFVMPANDVTITANYSFIDTSAADISITGDEITYVYLNETYTDQGATWTDNVDGTGNVSDITITPGGTVNTSTEREYLITYKYTDSSANIATKLRRVRVVQEVQNSYFSQTLIAAKDIPYLEPVTTRLEIGHIIRYIGDDAEGYVNNEVYYVTARGYNSQVIGKYLWYTADRFGYPMPQSLMNNRDGNLAPTPGQPRTYFTKVDFPADYVPNLYNLTLIGDNGVEVGTGQHQTGETVNISAMPDSEWILWDWSVISDTSATVAISNSFSDWAPFGTPIITGTSDSEKSGSSITLSNEGNILAIASIDRVRIYELINNGQEWTQRGTDITGQSAPSYGSGTIISLSSDGNIIAIGAPINNSSTGRVQIYEWNGSAWIQRGADLVGSILNETFGLSVSLSADGTILAIGSPGHGASQDENTGRVQIYEWNGSAWGQIGSDILGVYAGDNFGHSVSLSVDGTNVAIGAPYHDFALDYSNATVAANNAGLARVYEYDVASSTWAQRGSDIYVRPNTWNSGYHGSGFLGYSVDLINEGNIVAIGEPGTWSTFGSENSNTGKVHIYEWINNDWSSSAYEPPYNDPTPSGGDKFATSLSLGGRKTATDSTRSPKTRIAIGSPFSDAGGNDSGSVRVYEQVVLTASVPNWRQVGNPIFGGAANDQLGSSVKLSKDGNILVVGAPFNSDGANVAGHVKTYAYQKVHNFTMPSNDVTIKANYIDASDPDNDGALNTDDYFQANPSYTMSENDLDNNYYTDDTKYYLNPGDIVKVVSNSAFKDPPGAEVSSTPEIGSYLIYQGIVLRNNGYSYYHQFEKFNGLMTELSYSYINQALSSGSNYHIDILTNRDPLADDDGDSLANGDDYFHGITMLSYTKAQLDSFPRGPKPTRIEAGDVIVYTGQSGAKYGFPQDSYWQVQSIIWNSTFSKYRYTLNGRDGSQQYYQPKDPYSPTGTSDMELMGTEYTGSASGGAASPWNGSWTWVDT